MSMSHFETDCQLDPFAGTEGRLNPAEDDAYPVGGRLKRLFDIVFSCVAIVTFSLLMVAICAVLKLMSGGPIFFVHRRVGADGRMFPCLKFRTMVPDADERLQHILANDPKAAAEYAGSRKLRNDPRIIPVVGGFLRKTSLDELPQFFNVLVGHMSIVGPRPVTRDEWVEHYGMQHSYAATRPGITGLWQTSGRNDVTFAERVQMDTTYVENWSLALDLRIILRTVSIVCVHRNGH